MTIACYIGAYIIGGLIIVAWAAYAAVRDDGDIDTDLKTVFQLVALWPLVLAVAFGATLGDYVRNDKR